MASTAARTAGHQQRWTEQRAWIAAYVGVILLPVLLMIPAPEAGTADKQFAVALGFATFMGMSAQVVLAARVPALARASGIDVLIRLHRYMGVVLVVLLVTHVVVFILQRGTSMLEWMFFIDREPKAWSGALAWWGMVLITVTSVWRRRLGLTYERWRVTHLLLTAVALLAGYLHMLTAGDFVAWPGLRLVVTGALLAAIAAFAYLRVGRAFAAAGTPYVVESVRPERGDAVTVRLAAHGHAGSSFRPGDVAWLRFAGAPYSLTEHPFSIASATLDPRVIEFTCKRAGDLTSSLSGLPAGHVVYVDGPHGTGRPALDAPAHVLVTAGIGITPAMSLLRTLASDPARAATPVVLLHGARSEAEVTFAEELAQLHAALPNVRVVLALSRPDSSWGGHVGRIDSSLIERECAAELARGAELFACGPGDLLETVERTAARLGVPAARVHVERFEGA